MSRTKSEPGDILRTAVLVGASVAAALAVASTAPRASAAQVASDPPPAAVESPTGADPQTRLAQVRKLLEEATPLLDAETKEMLPTITLALERWATAPDETSEADLLIYRSIRDVVKRKGLKDRVSGDGPDPRAALALIKKKAQTASSVKPAIASGQRRVPGRPARSVGFVTVSANGDTKTIAEVPSAAGGLSPAQRAAKIAARIQEAAAKDPLWYLNARGGQSRGTAVVLLDRAPDGYIITADPEFARLRQSTPAELAKRLARDIRLTVDKPSLLAKARAVATPAERLAAAIERRVAGDAAYDRGDVTAAETEYRAGLREDKTYVVLYERLAGLYEERGDKAKLTEIVRAAIALPNLDAEQQRTFRSFGK